MKLGTTSIRIIALCFLVSCATPQYVDLTKEIEMIMEDEEIPETVRHRVARRLMDRQINEIRVVAKRNHKLESKVEKNQWKVNLVDGIIYTGITFLIGFAVYTGLRVKRFI